MRVVGLWMKMIVMNDSTSCASTVPSSSSSRRRGRKRRAELADQIAHSELVQVVQVLQ